MDAEAGGSGPVPKGAGMQDEERVGATPEVHRTSIKRRNAADRLRRAIERHAVQLAAKTNAERIVAQSPPNPNPTPKPPKGGRPREHDRKAVFDSLLPFLANGLSLREASFKVGISQATVRKWIATDSYCRQQYDSIKTVQADAMADRALREANRAATIDTPHGVAAQRLRVDTLKWYAAVLQPKKYGLRPDRDEGERVVRVIFEEDEPRLLPAGTSSKEDVEDAEYSLDDA